MCAVSVPLSPMKPRLESDRRIEGQGGRRRLCFSTSLHEISRRTDGLKHDRRGFGDSNHERGHLRASISIPPVATTSGRVSDRDHVYVILRSNAVDENERKPRNPQVMTTSPNRRIRSGVNLQTFDRSVGLPQESLSGLQRFLAVPSLRMVQFFESTSMKLDHACRSARSSALTDSQGIPGEPSLARASISARSPGSSTDQPGDLPRPCPTVPWRATAGQTRTIPAPI